ncbi:OBAP family protein [uncultured Stenotrophomonas sp.]|uniref:OBAP family protein n=1 Tax=uncultured Stenotrophomonas sp. TaxID=165438 RepID=UPI0028D06B72|nr:OBAP family protein [uncultured Stenotrophomonas sp.]
MILAAMQHLEQTNMYRSILSAAAALALTACGGGNTESSVQAPGAEETAKTKALETGAAVLQDRPPIEAINAYLDGFHFYNGQMDVQMEAHHYCSILNEDVIQCTIYDGNVKDAKLMGVEYIISETLFAGLPAQEKALWHSHVHEVKSGQLVAPGIPEIAEHELMEKLIRTYGKAWHTWHTDLDKDLPRGMPQLMMGFTADGQADPAMVAQRDARLGVSSEDKRKARADIPAPTIDSGADAWQKGQVVQIKDPSGGHSHGQQSQIKEVPGRGENATSNGSSENQPPSRVR